MICSSVEAGEPVVVMLSKAKHLGLLGLRACRKNGRIDQGFFASLRVTVPLDNDLTAN